MLDLDADPVHIDATLAEIPAVAASVARRPGLRSPGSPDGWGTLVFAILGQQRSVAAARTLAGRIMSRSTGESDRLRPFPAPGELASLDFEGIGLTRRTIATIVDAAELFDGRTSELGPGADRSMLVAELQSIKGIGPWTANYVAMRVLGHPDIYLAGDLVADRAASELGLTKEAIASASPWRSYLTHHLWALSSEVSEQTTRKKK